MTTMGQCSLRAEISKSRIIGARHIANTRCLEAVHKLVHRRDTVCMETTDLRARSGLVYGGRPRERMRNVVQRKETYGHEYTHRYPLLFLSRPKRHIERRGPK
jgi:hypothetical protein